MKRILVWAMLALVVVLSVPLFADGTVTTPISVTATSWKIGNVSMSTGAVDGPAGISITIFYFDGAGNILSSQTQVVILTNAEIVSFLSTVESSVPGESGSSVKRFRQRVTAWLVANNKITNVTPE